MIKGINITNFKGIGDPGIKLELAPVTLLFGGNSAGKSTIFHAMLLAYEIFVKGNRNPDFTELGGSSVDLGGFASFVHQHELDRPIRIEFELDMKSVRLDRKSPVDEFILSGDDPVDVSTIGEDVWSARVEVELTWHTEKKQVFVSEYTVCLNDEWFGSTVAIQDDPLTNCELVLNTRHSLLTDPLGASDGEHELNCIGVLDFLVPGLRTAAEAMYFEATEDLYRLDAEKDGGVPDYLDPDSLPPNDDIVDWKEYTYTFLEGEMQETTFILYRDYDNQIGIWDVEMHRSSDLIPTDPVFELSPKAQEIMRTRGKKKRSLNGEEYLRGMRRPRWASGIAQRAMRSSPARGAFRRTMGKTPEQREIAAQWVEFLNIPQRHVEVAEWPDALPIWDVEPFIEVEVAIASESYANPFDDMSEEEKKEFREERAKEDKAFHQLVTRLFITPGRLVAKWLEDFRHIGPLRDIPTRSYQRSLSPVLSSWKKGLAAWDALQSCDDSLIENVSDWLGNPERLGTGYSLKKVRLKQLDADGPIMQLLQPENVLDEAENILRMIEELPEITQIKICDNESQVQVAPSDIAIGITQLVPVLVAALDGHKGITTIEQPEIHSHPAVEVGLGDLFIEAVGEKDSGCKFLIETHGEHLLLRILRRIRETTAQDVDPRKAFQANRIAIYVFEKVNGATKVRRIEVDIEGEFIQPWPDDFFEIDFKERFN